MTTYSHDQFFRAFLTKLKLPVATPALRTLAAMSIYESSQGDEKWFNPFACTQPWPGAKPYNSFGNPVQHVWIYPAFDAGVSASAELFSGPHWADVRTHLKASTTRGPMLDAFSRAYSWANVNFRTLPTTTTPILDARRAHILRGPS